MIQNLDAQRDDDGIREHKKDCRWAGIIDVYNAPEEGKVWRGPRRGNAIFFGGKGMGGGGQTVLTLRLPEDKFAAIQCS